MLTLAIRDEEQGGKTVGVLVLADKTFASGKKGWFGQGKIEIDGVRYQAQAQLVRIGEVETESESDG